jgi:hydroxypyruvate reductase
MEPGDPEPDGVSMNPQLLDIFHAALRAVDPYTAVKESVRLRGNSLQIRDWACDLSRYDRIRVVGAGKGTAAMAGAVEEVFGDRLDRGIVVVKYGHTRPIGMKQIEAGHPIPDSAGVAGTLELIDLLCKGDERTLILCLITGGGSALLTAPLDGVTLEDKQRTTGLLLNAGAPIQELNAVRKHLSKVKGGRLAEMAYPSTIVTLIVSDVIGDPLDVIASGPTVPDRTTFQDAQQVIRKYGLQETLPGNVLRTLKEGAEGRIPETPKAGAPCFARSKTFILASLKRALDAAAARARDLGLRTELLTAELQGEAREAARFLAGRARAAQKKNGPLCLISGGETTVTVRGDGMGGRNLELALAFAMEMEDHPGVMLLSAGTDGTDGPTDAAGAIVDGGTAAAARERGLVPEDYLWNNDSYTFFQRLDESTGEGRLIRTGPTGTNVMDIQIMHIEAGHPG